MAERRMWSVTELIDLGIPSPGLQYWAAEQTALAAIDKRAAWEGILEAEGRDAALDWLKDARWRSVRKASDRGTAVHTHANIMVLGAVPPPPPEWSAQHVAQFERFLEDFQPEYVAAEAPVYNLQFGYAGTLDAIVRIDGQLCVIDYKTTDKGPDARSRPPYPEVALQLCAYSRAERLGTGPADIGEVKRKRYYTFDPDTQPSEPMIQVDGALALMISPVDYELHAARIDDTVWHCFLYACEIAKWSTDVSRTAIGPPLSPTRPATIEDVDIPEMLAEGILVEPEEAT